MSFYITTRSDKFLHWVYNAYFDMTNSFYVAVFSILFNKPIVMTERSDNEFYKKYSFIKEKLI